MGLGAICWNIIWTYDLDQMSRWYTEVLGLRVDHHTESVVAYDTGQALLLLLTGRANGPPQDPGTSGWVRNQVLLSFKVDDMDATLAELAGRGAVPIHVAPVVIAGVDRPKWRVAQFHDPEGNTIELCDEPIRWHPGLDG